MSGDSGGYLIYGNRSLPEKVQKIVYAPMEKLINIRGAHVHQTRFSDEKLDRVGMFALFESLGHSYGEHLQEEYMFAQLSWARQIAENNKATREIVNQYSSLITPIITAEDKIFLPTKPS